MKSIFSIPKFILGITLCFLSNRITAQNSNIFSGPVKRGVDISITPRVSAKFNPTIITKPNSPLSPTGVTNVYDGTDIRVFPSANIQAEVHISINKTNPDNLIASCNTYTDTYGQGYYFTQNGGLSWGGADKLQNPAQIPLSGDPSTAFNASGRAFISTVNSAGILTQSSINGGSTWSNLLYGGNGNQGNFDKEMIAVDNELTSPYINKLYCAWSWFPVPTLSNSNLFRVYFNASIDNGLSFSSPLTLKQGFGQGTNVQTGPSGEVYVCWADYNDAEDFTSDGIGFCKSTNGGASFSAYTRVINYRGIRIDGANPIFGNTTVTDFPSMAVDKSNGIHRGRIYIALPAKESGFGKAIIQVSFSDNQGNTWSNLNTVSISIGRQNWFPWITTDDNTGDVWVAYYSFDTPSGFETNTYVAHSSDNGVTWENQKVSDVSHITAPIDNTIFSAGYIGDYIGIVAFAGKAYPIWMDNRNGTWQLYCSPATFCILNTGIPTNLTASSFSPPQSPSGYYLNFTTVPGVTNYVMEWFDVNTNSSTFINYPITYPSSDPSGYFFYYFTAGHTYKYRVATANCGNLAYGTYSNWSPLIFPPAASCASGPIASTLTQSRGCGNSPGCLYTNLSWPAISGAIEYKIEYNVFNSSTGFSYPTVTTTTSYTSSPVYKTVGLPNLSGPGWYIKYRVAAKCGSTYGNFSNWSSTFFLQ